VRRHPRHCRWLSPPHRRHAARPAPLRRHQPRCDRQARS
jgi:hypothetical protein